MLFNSFEFILFYLILLVLFYTIQPRKRWILILLGSMIFFMYFKVFYLLLILFTILVSYYTSRFIITHPKSKKAILIAGIIIHLFLLCYYKYFSFMLLISKDFFNFSSSRLDLISSEIILPIGISFFTFQAIGYEIDVFRDEKNYEKNIAKLSLFILFFPQLVAGPIERASNVLPQLKKNLKNRFNYSLILEGFDQILLGFFKKIVVADTLSVYINNTYQNTNSTPSESLVAIILFSFQIYCDFSGYSDIAIGIGKTFNIKLMENFQQPYFSKSVTEFWRRWHISLSTWFKDYLFIPLGGSRRGNLVTYRNIFLVFLISGIWHGANYTFIIWGSIHGIILIVEKIMSRQQGRSFPDFVLRIWTFIIVTVAWVFFRSESLPEAIRIFESISHFKLSDLEVFYQPKIIYYFILIVMLLLVDYSIYHKGMKSINLKNPTFRVITIIFILIFGSYEQNSFIYFQF